MNGSTGDGLKEGGGARDRFDDDRHCFVCGEKNPFGLQLQPKGKDGRGTISWVPDRRHQGFEGVVHGGLISTLLDESMAYAAMSVGGFCATAEIAVKFIRPVRTGIPVKIEARLVEQRGRLLKLEASVIQEGEEKAKGRGTFLQVTGGRKGD
ncbi:MAG: PaaI family thioesterase [Candidatus Fermentibacteraceae bacterium]|nr:PaaI family thioesterase [Candidatus Fermentibacteraceae bacterium]MBN2608159.1 PaaI family thioesterase [Candidatus Fermentibacteraceae bacterium]